MCIHLNDVTCIVLKKLPIPIKKFKQHKSQEMSFIKGREITNKKEV